MKSCPVCSYEIQINVNHCPFCNSDLKDVSNVEEDKRTPTSPEQLVPRLGDFLVAKKLISEIDIERAITFQKKARMNGRNVLIGEALVHLGFIRKKDLDNAIAEQIFQLQDALKRSNAELEKRVEERTLTLQKTLNKLTILNDLKADFIANISHELRTPMAHIIGYVDLLRDESLGSLSRDQEMALDTIVKANDKVMILLDNLLQFNGFAENTMKIYPEEFILNDVLFSIETKYRSIIKNRNLNFIAEFPSNSLKINADRDKILWVIEQLLDNAIKFNRSDGVIKFTVKEKGDMVHFQIIDNGFGIPEEKLELVFEAFVQLEESLTRETGGTGIGLTIVKQIIEAHNSRIILNSVVNQGTSFEFYLPLM